MPQWVTSNYKVGDLVIFDFDNTGSETDHIGIVEAVNGSTLTTIEGNTSASSSGSQSNGEGVWRKSRSASLVHGAYRPDYTSAMTAEKVLTVARGEIGYIEGSDNNNKYGVEYGLNNKPYCVIFVWWCFRHAGMSSLFCGGAKCAICSGVKRYAQEHSTSPSASSSSSSTTKRGYTCKPEVEIVQSSSYASSGTIHSLQTLLISKGFSCGSCGADGEFGPGTKNAIIAAQKKLGLTADGSAGADTWAALIATEV